MSREQSIISEVERWAARHPRRDVAVLVFGSASYSPRQIADEIRSRSRAGLELLSLFEEAADAYSMDDLLESFGLEGAVTGSRSDHQ
jgi:hypothetical protein